MAFKGPLQLKPFCDSVPWSSWYLWGILLSAVLLCCVDVCPEHQTWVSFGFCPWPRYRDRRIPGTAEGFQGEVSVTCMGWWPVQAPWSPCVWKEMSMENRNWLYMEACTIPDCTVFHRPIVCTILVCLQSISVMSCQVWLAYISTLCCKKKLWTMVSAAVQPGRTHSSKCGAVIWATVQGVGSWHLSVFLERTWFLSTPLGRMKCTSRWSLKRVPGEDGFRRSSRSTLALLHASFMAVASSHPTPGGCYLTPSPSLLLVRFWYKHAVCLSR